MHWPLLVPLTLLLGMFVSAQALARRNRTHPAFWLSLLYLGSCVAALFVDVDILSRNSIRLGDDALASLTGYGITLVLWLLPSLALRNQIVRRLDVRTLEIFVIATAPLVLFSAVYQAPIAWEGISIGADVVRNNLNNRGIGLLPESPLTTIAVVTAQFYFLYTLAFAVSIVSGGRRWVRVVAFIGSTLYLINSFCFAARDGILWFLVAYLWAFWLVKPLLTERLATRIRRAVLPVATLGVVAFGLFSVQRFGDRSEGNLTDYLLLYYGAQPYVFAADVDQQREFYGGRLRLPLLFELAGLDAKVVRESPYEWSFGTFAKDIYGEGGWPSLLIAAIVAPFLITLALAVTSGRFPEAHLLIGMAYVQFMSQGVFYFRLGTRAGNLYLLLIGALAVGMACLRVRSRGRIAR